MDFTTQFETVYDLLSEDDHATLRRVLDDCGATDSSAADLEDGCCPSDAGDSVPRTSAAVDCASHDLYLVCRMNAATSLRRVSSVSRKPYRLKVGAIFMPNIPHRPYMPIITVSRHFVTFLSFWRGIQTVSYTHLTLPTKRIV